MFSHLRKLQFVFGVTLFFGCVTCSYSQVPTWTWATQDGHPQLYENVQSLSTDIIGNSYVAGIFSGDSAIFGPFTIHNTDSGNYASYLAKYDQNGSIIWIESINSDSDVISISSVTDILGNTIVAGYFHGSYLACGNDTLNNVDIIGTDAFIIKYDSSGNLVWAKNHGATATVQARAITVNNSGEIFLAGKYIGDSLILDTFILPTPAFVDIFIVKYDPAGNIIMATNFFSPGYQEPTSITTNPQGLLVVAGNYQSTLFLGNDTLLNAGITDYFITTLDSLLWPLWAVSGSSDNYDYISSISVDNSGNIYAVGYTKSAVLIIGQDSLVNNYPPGENLIIVKYNSSGIPQWGIITGHLSTDVAHDVSVDVSGNIYVVGGMSLGTVFGAFTTSITGTFIAKLSPSGNVFWVLEVPNAYTWECETDNSDHVNIAGRLSDSTNFGSIFLNSIGNDIFIAQLDVTTGISLESSISQLNIFPNPSDENLFIDGIPAGEQYSITITNSLGQVVLVKEVSDGERTVNVAGLTPGIFVVMIQVGGNVSIHEIIVQ